MLRWLQRFKQYGVWEKTWVLRPSALGILAVLISHINFCCSAVCSRYWNWMYPKNLGEFVLGTYFFYSPVSSSLTWTKEQHVGIGKVCETPSYFESPLIIQYMAQSCWWTQYFLTKPLWLVELGVMHAMFFMMLVFDNDTMSNSVAHRQYWGVLGELQNYPDSSRLE